MRRSQRIAGFCLVLGSTVVAVGGCGLSSPPSGGACSEEVEQALAAAEKKRSRDVASLKKDLEALKSAVKTDGEESSSTGGDPKGAGVKADTADIPIENDSASDGSCPDDMALVEGDSCRFVEQRCLKYAQREGGGEDKRRCEKFAPSVCKDDKPRRKMRYCMDRYEYPNEKGKIPWTLVSYTEASEICAQHGKRLCTANEFNFACEGEQMQPYAHGDTRDDDKCNYDKPFVKRKVHMLPRLECEVNAACKAEMQRLDGREPAGSHPECKSPFGVYDMNGNVNEWVHMPWKDPPNRSGLKGGWWGPVRNRCRPIAMSHDERYIGYEVGFRCCKDAAQEQRFSREKKPGELAKK